MYDSANERTRDTGDIQRRRKNNEMQRTTEAAAVTNKQITCDDGKLTYKLNDMSNTRKKEEHVKYTQ